eukprot:CAMPEP_0197251706 /NCGR_PEP_ID=MMETSP1429-20130617/58273_1 /TAXON_ID=49237 /ORGANISM="Chaetoceros  sp., Strain UNC1202" /LENGTH=137 /DNA_ID=CAMNT_0042713877 /DNA_START=52 /DNA_END=465 /DNA_ORIENTATION=-
MKRPTPAALPTSLTKTIENPETELCVTIFSDRIQILVSQKLGKIGTMLSCTHEFSQIDNSHTYHVENLLGNREDALNSVYARQIMEQIAGLGDGINCPPLLLGITLKGKSSQQEFKLIVNESLSLYQEAIKIISSNN